jgi:hypothetical protein
MAGLWGNPRWRSCVAATQAQCRTLVSGREGPTSVTLGHMRAHGVRRLLLYCCTGLCHHSATIGADHWPDETEVRDLCRKAVCTICGMIGADVRPDWTQRPQPESLTGTQWS